MGVREVIEIETCRDCRHCDHTGGFTPGGAKLCCGHSKTCATKGFDCFKRVIEPPDMIPDWCPLRPQSTEQELYPELPKGYGAFPNFSIGAFKLLIGVMDFSLNTAEAPERFVYDGKKYKRGNLMVIPKELSNLCCSCREYDEVDEDGKYVDPRR